jgi:hypothetical protein
MPTSHSPCKVNGTSFGINQSTYQCGIVMSSFALMIAKKVEPLDLSRNSTFGLAAAAGRRSIQL